jgi:predicted nucleotidyltransferase
MPTTSHIDKPRVDRHADSRHIQSRVEALAMRLKQKEQDAIAQAAREVFTPGTSVFLFGSRVDDGKHGGDIDLLIETHRPMAPAELVERRTRFVARLYRALEEQRIDVVITAHHESDPRPVVAEARRTAILLART